MRVSLSHTKTRGQFPHYFTEITLLHTYITKGGALSKILGVGGGGTHKYKTNKMNTEAVCTTTPIIMIEAIHQPQAVTYNTHTHTHPIPMVMMNEQQMNESTKVQAISTMGVSFSMIPGEMHCPSL